MTTKIINRILTKNNVMMKKILNGLLTIAAIVAMTTVSCQNEESFDTGIDPGTIVEAQFQPVIPASATSLSSGNGGTGNVDDASYDLRYILEVWSDDGVTCEFRDTAIATGYATSVDFSVHLPAAEYKFVFWADFVTKGSKADLTYNTGKTGGLKDIEWTASAYYSISDDLRDAYYAVENVDLTSGNVNGNVTLKRPFGKLRVLATDLYDEGVTPTKAVLSYTHTATPLFRKSFNALTGEPNATTIDASGDLESVPELETSVTIAATPYNNVYLLAFDYFLVPADLTAVSFDIELFDGATSLGVAKSISNVPVGINKLTTVIGAFLPSPAQGEANFTVIVDDDFDDDNAFTTTVESVLLNKTNLWLNAVGQETLIATVLPANATNKNVTWSSSDIAVAIVDNNGKVTAVATGSAIIRATSNANAAKAATCEVTVVPIIGGEMLQNGWFIEGLDNWSATPDVFKRATDTYLPTSSPSGAYYITENVSATQGFEGRLTQHLTNVPDGNYTLSCDVGGYPGNSPSTDGVYLIAIDKFGVETQKKLPFPSGAWMSMKYPERKGECELSVTVTDGECTVGLYVKAAGGAGSTMTFKVLNFKFE
jgi:uncharacterized protein YjdB